MPEVVEQSAWNPLAASFDVAFSAAPVAMAVVDLGGRIRRSNGILAELTGRPGSSLTGVALADLVHADDVPEQMVQIHRLLRGELSGTSLSQQLLRGDGTHEPVRVHVSIVRDDEGKPHHFVVQIASLGERDRLLERMRHESDHDALTGLMRRHAFAAHTARHIGQARSRGQGSALIVIDLDGFRDVNDSLGTAVGDEVLRAVGALIATRLSDGDHLARLDGDEFGILISGADATTARDTARGLLKLIADRGFRAGSGTPVHLSASAGVAVTGTGDADDLLGEAEMALREAKVRSGGQAVVFDSAMRVRRHVLGRRRGWVQKLRHALASGSFVLDAQPIVAVAGGDVDHHELLVRMLDDDGSVVRPNVFLGVAERFGLMPAIDEWVIRRAIGLVAERAAAGQPLSVAVNLGRGSLENAALLAQVTRMLNEKPEAGRHLIFEITDRGDVAPTRRVMSALAEFGCRFTLDDFGAGMASFAFLKHLPFDFIKLDGEFTRGLPDSATDQAIVGAVVEAARSLGRTVIAECVEDDEILAAVAAFGIDLAQGLRVGRPARAEQALALA